MDRFLNCQSFYSNGCNFKNFLISKKHESYTTKLFESDNDKNMVNPLLTQRNEKFQLLWKLCECSDHKVKILSNLVYDRM